MIREYTGDVVLLCSRCIFSVFLLVFSWQDFCRKRIRVSGLYGFGAAGTLLLLIRFIQSVTMEEWGWKQQMLGILFWFLGLLPGILLLLLERQTQGAVGSGDGYFFLFAGFYLGGWQTLELLMGSVFVSSLAGAVWILTAQLAGKERNRWEKMRKKRLPFLPCVLPVWFWMLVSVE